MPVGTTDSLGRYYWCKTASTTDANCWYHWLPKTSTKSECKELRFQIWVLPHFPRCRRGGCWRFLSLVFLHNVDWPLFTYQRVGGEGTQGTQDKGYSKLPPQQDKVFFPRFGNLHWGVPTSPLLRWPRRSNHLGLLLKQPQRLAWWFH